MSEPFLKCVKLLRNVHQTRDFSVILYVHQISSSIANLRRNYSILNDRAGGDDKLDIGRAMVIQ